MKVTLSAAAEIQELGAEILKSLKRLAPQTYQDLECR